MQFLITNCFAQNNRLWATYLGGAGADQGNSVATDVLGNVYLTGLTTSSADIASGGFQNFGGGLDQDAYLVKFDASGNRLWATYYGGTGIDVGYSVATDVAGNVYMAGATKSVAGIASGGFQNAYGGGLYDGFLVKFDASGNRLWGTYYGGAGLDMAWSVATDAFGNVYLGGSTDSPTGIASGGFQNTFGGGMYDNFLAKFDGSGNRLWATYYGGPDFEEDVGVATDAVGNVYMAGETQSISGIASGGFQNTGNGFMNAFLVKFDGSGNRLWATYYGAGDASYGYSVATDPAGNVYMAGITTSNIGLASGGFQNIYGGGYWDAFLVKFDPAGSRLWATYYGGAGDEEGTGVATDVSGNVYLAGQTSSLSGIASGGFQNNLGGAKNEFLVKFDSNGNRLCATYYGREPIINANEYGPVAVDRFGNVYLAEATPSASGIASGGFQNTSGGGLWDAYLVKFTSCCNNFTTTIMGTDVICRGDIATLNASGGSTYSWSLAGATGQTITVTPSVTTTYTVTAIDNSGCTGAAVFTVTVSPTPTANISGSATIFQGQSATLSASGGGSYIWYNGSTDSLITVAPLITTQYCVTVVDTTTHCANTACAYVFVESPCDTAGEFFFPNAFSPNHDGENDFLKIYYGNMSCIQSLHLVIYDRWGEKLFETTDPEFNWNGDSRGKRLNTQVITYYLRVQLVDQTWFKKKGNINLIR